MMRNWKYIMAVLCLCFLGKVQAQDARWTSEQTDKAKTEVELINDVITLTENQKVLLTEILLEKNRSLENTTRLSTSRRNWNVNIYLKRIEDILRYGYEINRNPNQTKLKSNKEMLAKEVYVEKVLDNDDLRQKLNLNIIND